jgi:hypothetical protein
MGEMPHRSRREILQSISILGSGSLLLPLGVLNGALLDDRPRGTIRGVLRDGASGKPVAAKMRVSNSGEAVKGTLARRAEAAGSFVDDIEQSIRFIRKNYRFASEADKALALGRFEEGRAFYAKLVAQQ